MANPVGVVPMVRLLADGSGITSSSVIVSGRPGDGHHPLVKRRADEQVS